MRGIVTQLSVSPIAGNRAVGNRTAVEASPDMENTKEVGKRGFYQKSLAPLAVHEVLKCKAVNTSIPAAQERLIRMEVRGSAGGVSDR